MYQITKEHYTQNLKERFPNDDFTVLEFINASSPVSIKCNKCGQIFNYKTGTTLYNKRRKHFCPLCNSKMVIAMREACERENIIITNIAYNTTDSWTLHCNRCGKDFERAPATWEQYSCPYCGKNATARRYDKNWYQQAIDERFGKGEFTILGDNPKSAKIRVQHKCGFIRDTQFTALIHSKGCPRCSGTMSKGERKIINYLDAHNIKYIPQQKMGNTKQTFDFYLPNKNIAIEYNGEQHYKPIETFGGEKRFLQQQQYDANKIQYCKDNNITLKIISYLEFNNIDTLLDDFFKKFNDQSQDVEEN